MSKSTDKKTATGADIDVFILTAPELIKELATTAESILINNYHYDKDVAKKIAVDFGTAFAQSCGGMQVYIPVGAGIQISERNLEIYNKFTGHNHNELAKEFGLSVQWIYKILKKVEKHKQDEVQPRLF